MSYFKTGSAEIFFERSKNIPVKRACESRILGKKLGYDNMEEQSCTLRLHYIPIHLISFFLNEFLDIHPNGYHIEQRKERC